MYKITRLFIGGLLNGLTHTGTYTSPMTVGFVCQNPVGGSPYKVVECVEVDA